MRRSPLAQLILTLVIAMLVGALAGGEIFRRLTAIEPTLFVRLSLGIAACFAFGFVATLYRVLRGEPALEFDMPSGLSNGAAFVVALAAAVLVATTVFR